MKILFSIAGIHTFAAAPHCFTILLTLFFLPTSIAAEAQETVWKQSMDQGIAAYGLGNLDEAEIEFSSAKVVAEKYFPKTVNHSISLYWLGNVYLFSQRNEEAEKTLKQAALQLEALAFDDPQSMFDVYESLGYASLSLGYFAEAERNWEIALEFYDRVPLVDEYEIARRMLDYCDQFKNPSALLYAERCYTSALEICLSEKPGNSQCGLSIYSSLGEVSTGLEKFEIAVESFDNSIAIARVFEEPFFSAMALNNAGKSLLNEPLYIKAAEEYLTEALAVANLPDFMEKLPPDLDTNGATSMKVTILLNLAQLHALNDKPDASDKIMKEAQRICDHTLSTADNISESMISEVCVFGIKAFVIIGKMSSKNEAEAFEAFSTFLKEMENLGWSKETVAHFAVYVNAEYAARLFELDTLPELESDWFRAQYYLPESPISN